MHRSKFLISAPFLVLAACGAPASSPADAPVDTRIKIDPNCLQSDALEGDCQTRQTGLSLVDLQTVGSHNSYKISIPEIELGIIALTSEEAARSLDYGHLPLIEQMDLGMRQLELDVARDPDGGLYANPLLPRMAEGQSGAVPFDADGLDAPGYKVLHTQDIDPRTHCKTFISCLQQIDAWSLANPDHVPMLILVNLKSGDLDIPGTVVAPEFTEAAFDDLDGGLKSVLEPERYITPDDVRGDHETLRGAVLSGAWPSLEDARGKLIFALDAGPVNVGLYLRDNASLQTHPMFVNSISETADHAAYFTMNDPVRAQQTIRARVAQGFLVRTRSDAGTEEARSNDTNRREAAFTSGAHYISTDYYLPRYEWSEYKVELPGIVRCNPVRYPGCAATLP